MSHRHVEVVQHHERGPVTRQRRPEAAEAASAAAVPPAPAYAIAAPFERANAASSAASRDFPLCAGPETTTTRPYPRRACRHVPRSQASSALSADQRRVGLEFDRQRLASRRRRHPRTERALRQDLDQLHRRVEPLQLGACRPMRSSRRRSLLHDPPARSVTSTCPAAACEQSRAAVFSAAPRNPSSTGTASPTSMPTPTSRGSVGSAATLLGARRLQLRGCSHGLGRRRRTRPAPRRRAAR